MTHYREQKQMRQEGNRWKKRGGTGRPFSLLLRNVCVEGGAIEINRQLVSSDLLQLTFKLVTGKPE